MHEERAGEPQEAALVPVEVVPENRALDLRRQDLVHEADQWVLRFTDKGGKHR